MGLGCRSSHGAENPNHDEDGLDGGYQCSCRRPALICLVVMSKSTSLGTQAGESRTFTALPTVSHRPYTSLLAISCDFKPQLGDTGVFGTLCPTLWLGIGKKPEILKARKKARKGAGVIFLALLLFWDPKKNLVQKPEKVLGDGPVPPPW